MTRISIESNSERFSHFDTIIMCGGFDRLDTQKYVEVARGEKSAKMVSLEVDEIERIEVIIYIIPPALPKGKNRPISDFEPFDARVAINSTKGEVYNKVHQINGWGGSVVKLNLKL